VLHIKLKKVFVIIAKISLRTFQGKFEFSGVFQETDVSDS